MLETHFPIKTTALTARLTVVKFMFLDKNYELFSPNETFDWPFWYRKYEKGGSTPIL